MPASHAFPASLEVKLGWVLTACLGLCAGQAQEPTDWKSEAPRAEIAPRFWTEAGEGKAPGGLLGIAADGDAAADGRWVGSLPVSAGKHYRFTSRCKAKDVALPERSVLARVVWLDERGKQVEQAEYPAAASASADGWSPAAGVYRAPEGAARARLELHLRWTLRGQVLWEPARLEEVAPPAPRKVRLAAVNHRPRGGKSSRENLEQFVPAIEEAARRKADFVCLGEGVTVAGLDKSYVEVAEPVPGPSTEFLGTLAAKHRLFIIAGVYERKEKRVYNTSLLLGRDGQLLGKYRKVCLPREEIDGGITPGSEYPVFETEPGKVGMMICWDLSFPEVARELARKGAEVIFLPIWGGNETLARARAIENQVYLVTSGYDIPTAIYDKTGKEIAKASKDPEVIMAEVDLGEPQLWPWLGDWRSRIWSEAPEPGALFRGRISDLVLARAAGLERILAEARGPESTAAGREIAGRLTAGLRAEIEAIRAGVKASMPSAPELSGLGEAAGRLEPGCERAASILRFARACEDAGALPSKDVLVGYATSMEKVLPREAPVALSPAKGIEVRLARNEKESFQLAVLPVARDLSQVSLRSSDLKSEGGGALSAANVQCDVVGYVETKSKPPYDVSCLGWWPDPILDFLGPIRIAAGDVQCFWVRVRAPADQAPGIYRGALTLTAEGIEPIRIDWAVRVRSFAVPAVSPLPLAVTFGLPLEEEYSKMLRRLASGPDWNAKLKYAWADFLADYYLGWDHLYRPAPPDFDVLAHLHKQGRLGAFNLGNFSVYAREGPKPAAAALDAMLRWAREARAGAERLGILDHAYIYGFDEANADWFPVIEATAATVKREIPGALVLTTAYDASYGVKSVMKSIDAWTPLTAAYNPENAAAARAAGKQVWWYICCGPHHPHANMFVEYPAIEGRLLMGAMAAKYRPDGFLYYQISIWRSQSPIEGGPFTDWNPTSWTTYHGDGSWTCAGPDGTPLPTIRLENFRDGLEDLAYVRVLEEAIKRREARGESLTADDHGWLAEARAALEVPEALVKSLTDYSRDPGILYTWRDRAADLIEKSGLRDLDPWAKGFSLRR